VTNVQGLAYGQGQAPRAGERSASPVRELFGRVLITDRPDGFGPHMSQGKASGVMSYNACRRHEQVAHMNRCGPQPCGRITESMEGRSDDTAATLSWALILLCGGSSNGVVTAYFAGLNP
jgi:secreted PhoX family phosphatase